MPVRRALRPAGWTHCRYDGPRDGPRDWYSAAMRTIERMVQPTDARPGIPASADVVARFADQAGRPIADQAGRPRGILAMVESRMTTTGCVRLPPRR